MTKEHEWTEGWWNGWAGTDCMAAFTAAHDQACHMFNIFVHRTFVTVSAAMIWQMPSNDVSALTKFPKKQTFSLSTRHPGLHISVPAVQPVQATSLIVHHSRLTVHYSSLTVHHRSLAIHHRSLTIHHSSLIVHHSSLTIHHRSLTAHHRSLTIHHSRATVHTSSRRTRHRLGCQTGGRRSPNRIMDLTPSCPTTSMSNFLQGDWLHLLPATRYSIEIKSAHTRIAGILFSLKAFLVHGLLRK